MIVGQVDTKDISVVVQGPVVLNTEFYSNGWTNEALKRVRMCFPGSEIILSTWKGNNISGLDFDILVENDDPGAFVSNHTFGGAKSYYNLNRQIHSSKQGLRYASRRFALKMRTDTIFRTNNILSYFGVYPNRCNDLRIFNERVITGYIAGNPHRTRLPFFLPDFLHFGFTEDIKLLWDIPLAPEPETAQWFLQHKKPPFAWLSWHPSSLFRYAPEQYIWYNLLRKNMPEIPFDNMFDFDKKKGILTDILFANNVVLLDMNMLGLEHLKFTGDKITGQHRADKSSYLKKKFNSLTHLYFHGYSHRNWLSLYYRYCCNKIVFPHIWYDLLFPSILSLYHFIKSVYRRFKYI